MPYQIPIGPYHPALKEPYKLKLSCTGETVQAVDIEIGFTLRAIELLVQRRNYIQGLVLVEHVYRYFQQAVHDKPQHHHMFAAIPVDAQRGMSRSAADRSPANAQVLTTVP